MKEFTFRITTAGIDREQAEDFIKGVILGAIDSLDNRMVYVPDNKLGKLEERRNELLRMRDSIEAV